MPGFSPLSHLTMPEQPKGLLHKAASVNLLEVDKGKTTLIMLKILKDKDSTEYDARYDQSFSFPGGKIAKLDDNSEKEGKAEQGNPLLTAARNLHEECKQVFPSTEEAWQFLNQETTVRSVNGGWEYFPVVQYTAKLTPELSGRFTHAIDNPEEFKTANIALATRVSLDAISVAYKSCGWSAEGLKERSRLINEARAKGEEADLSEFIHLDSDLLVKDIYGKDVNIAPYIARSLFGELDKLVERTKTIVS